MHMLKEAKNVLNVLLQNGYQAYFVGGYVRDTCAGRPVQDIDIATSAKPEEVMRLFPRTVPTGLAHGTVTVIMSHHVYEVTTFRIESDYEQYRRPQEVRFVEDLILDLERRDFTMNAMAMDREGRLIDPFDGMKDLERGILRCVGDPRERFSEDGLRMLRCVRFAAEYGLEIDPLTWEALIQQREIMIHIAMERVRIEWERMVAGNDPGRAFQMLFESGLLRYLKKPLPLPAIHWSGHDMPPILKRIGELSDSHARWALFMMIQQVTATVARQTLDRLTFAKSATQEIVAVIACHERLEQSYMKTEHTLYNSIMEDRSARWAAWSRHFKYAVVRTGEAAVQCWLAIAALCQKYSSECPICMGTADESKAEYWATFLTNGNKWLSEMPVARLTELHVRGMDIAQAVGKRPGPWLGEVLDRLLLDVAYGGLINEYSQLIEQAIKYDKEWNQNE